MFEILEHPADVGFRTRERMIEDLFASSADALQSIALEIERTNPTGVRTVEVSGSDPADLLVNFLNEVLYLIDGEQLVTSGWRFPVLTETTLAATCQIERTNPSVHHSKLVVKAVTWHQLRVEREGDGWVAEVFLDI